jgi:hypothetical protein
VIPLDAQASTWNPMKVVVRAMRRVFLALFAVLLLGGCELSKAETPPVTESEAYDRVEAYVRRAANALPDKARIEAAAPSSSEPCKGEPAGRVRVVTNYFVRDIAAEDKQFDTMLKWWEAHDFTLLDDLRPERPYVWVKSNTDDFRMSLRANENGELVLGAESPCLRAG